MTGERGRARERREGRVPGHLSLRHRWLRWRLRYAPVPSDGAALTTDEELGWLAVLRSAGDHAGTARVAAAEHINVTAARHATAEPGNDAEDGL
jgi:hypothetical protein